HRACARGQAGPIPCRVTCLLAMAECETGAAGLLVGWLRGYRPEPVLMYLSSQPCPRATPLGWVRVVEGVHRTLDARFVAAMLQHSGAPLHAGLRIASTVPFFSSTTGGVQQYLPHACISLARLAARSLRR